MLRPTGNPGTRRIVDTLGVLLVITLTLIPMVDANAMDHTSMEHGSMEHKNLPADEPLRGHSIYHLDGEWTSHRNESFSLARFRGRPVIVTMIFSRCAGTCPVLMQDARRIYQGLPEDLRRETTLVAISFDHDHDTPEVLADYAAYRHYNDPDWHFLHGPRAQVREIATVLGIRYALHGDGSISHTDRIAVLDREGVIVDTLDGIMQPVGQITAALERRVR